MKLFNRFKRFSQIDERAASPRPASIAGTATPVPPGVTLQDLALLKVPVSWQEAVAVMLESLDGLSDGWPDPGTVTLSPTGELHRAEGRALTGHPVRRAAAFFNELTGSAPIPAALRTLIDGDLADGPVHPSLSAFARGLAYFERPGRRADVAAVHTRAHASYLRATADRELERLRASAVREPQPAVRRRPSLVALSGQRIGHAAFVAVLCAVIVVSGFSLVSMAFPPAPPALDDGGPPVPPDATAALIQDGLTQVKEVFAAGLAAAGARITALTDRVSVTPARPSPPEKPRRPSRAARAGIGASRAGASIPADASVSRVRDTQWTVSVRDVTASVTSAAPDAAPPRDTPEPALPIFSADDSDVEPARLTRPQLPSRVRKAASVRGQVGVLELVVNERGTVDLVRLTSSSNRLNEKMLVAAGKAWAFEPAHRDGLPVRYRVRVEITE